MESVLDEKLDVLHAMGKRGAELIEEIDALEADATIASLVWSPKVAEIVRRASPRQRKDVQAALANYLGTVGPKRHVSPELAKLQDWAREHACESSLESPLKSLDSLVGWDDRRWLYAGRTGEKIRDLFDDRWTDAKPSGARQAQSRLKKAARALLEREAAVRAAALAEEAERLAFLPPDEPHARELHGRVRAERRVLRETLAPRSLSALKLQHGLLPDPLTFILDELDWPHQARVAVGLQAARAEDPLAITCTCTHAGRPRCAHVLTALDCLVDLLADPRRRNEAAAMVAELLRPQWARALAELDRSLAPDVAPAESRFAWRLGGRGPDFQLTPVVQRRSKRGSFSSGSRCDARSILEGTASGALDADREAATLLAVSTYQPSAVRRLVRRALLALVGHPRVTLADPPHEAIAVRTATLAFVAREEDDGSVVLEPTIDGTPVDARRLLGGEDLACLVDEATRSCVLARVDARARALVELLARRGGRFPVEALPELTLRLPALGQRVQIALPGTLRGTEVPADERVRLRLELLPGAAPGLRVAARVQPLVEGRPYVPGEGPAEPTGERAGARVYAARDLGAEGPRVRERLAPLALRPESEIETEPFTWLLDRGDEALDFLAVLQERADDFAVEWAAEARAVTRWAAAGDLRVSVTDKRDWFGLDGGVETGDGHVPLARLLEAVRARRRYVEVKGGVWLRIADDLRARLDGVADHVFSGRGGLEVSRLGAPALVDLLDDTEVPRGFRELVGRIQRAGASCPEPPAELAPVLRDYQRSGFEWLSRLSAWSTGACLADDMGIGKTIQALALLVERAALGPALVVAPTSVGWNWMREMERFAPSLKGILYREADRGESLQRLGPGQVLVVSYTLLAGDVDALAAVAWSTLVLDEAQAIKNPATQRARAAITVAAKAGFCLALSGTPLENRLAELWSLMRVVTPGLLGSWEHFRTRFAGPIERDRDAERQVALARVVRPFILRRLKGEVAPELPARTEVRENVTLSTEERRLYDEVRRAALAELAAPSKAVTAQQRRFQVLTALLRLRQLACNPRLVHPDSTIASSKLERLLELVEELREGGHRALVFSQFASHLALVRAALAAADVPALYLDGQTPAERREELVGAFQRGEGDVFLISLKAGGTGLNLTAADVVIHLDPWWNPAVEDQATDRAHRIGQERPVTIYRLVAHGTIEDAILDLHEDKRRLVAGVLDGTGAAATLSTEELLALLDVSPSA